MENPNIPSLAVTKEESPSWMLGSVAKCIRTLKTFTVNRPEWTLTQLSKELSISKSTMVNILKTLESFGYIQKLPNQHYRLGIELLELSYHIRASLPILHSAIPIMEEIQRQSGQIVYLTIPKKGKAFYLQSVNPGNRNISYSITGRCTLMHCSCCGKIMLSEMSEEMVDLIIDTYGLPRFTTTTITKREALKAELQTIRDRGYAIENCEEFPNVKGVAVPICSSNRLLGSLSLTGSVLSMPDENMVQYATLLANGANLLASNEEFFPKCDPYP
ncbi:MAG: IclR family transcriptional regulator [Lachnospiraceae bacterium]|nr:IclR family transcriptional regulator [Lachnospiraceae bacterium]